MCSVKTQRILKGSVAGIRALLIFSDWLGSCFILMPVTSTERAPRGEKWDIKSRWPLNLFIPLGRHSSEAVRSCEGYSLIEISCHLHLLKREEEPQEHFTTLALYLPDQLCSQTNKYNIVDLALFFFYFSRIKSSYPLAILLSPVIRPSVWGLLRALY